MYNPPYWYDKQFGLKPGCLYKAAIYVRAYKYSDLQNLKELQHNNIDPFVEPEPTIYTLPSTSIFFCVRNMFYLECQSLGLSNICYNRPTQNYPIFLYRSTTENSFIQGGDEWV